MPTGIYPRKPLSEATKRKIGLANKIALKRFYNDGGLPWNKGKSLSEETRKKLSLSLKGKIPWNKGEKGLLAWNKGKTKTDDCRIAQPWLGKKRLDMLDDNNPRWKGDDVGYLGLHAWVNKKLGKPDICEHCGLAGLSGHQIHWANRTGEYKRDLDDWLRLCVKCHKQYDMAMAI